MSGFEELKGTFFEETDELLLQLEQGLGDLHEAATNDEAVNAIFRAVHSIKGGAGVFGFSALVDFAHIFETVLDEVRRGTLAVNENVIAVFLRANDTLSDLVLAAREDRPVSEGFGWDCREELGQLLGGPSEPAADSGDIAGLEFTPVRFDDSDESAQETTTFVLTLRPTRAIMEQGHDLGAAFERLRQLGTLDLIAETENLPSIETLDAEESYLIWNATLATTASRDDVAFALASLEGVCEIVLDTCGVSSAGVEQDDWATSFSSDLEPTDAISAPPLAPLAAPAFEPGVFSRDSESNGIVAREPLALIPGDIPAASVSMPHETPVAPMRKLEERPSAPAENSAAGANAKNAAMTIRVELEKIDRVVNMVGELVIAQAMLGQAIEDLPDDPGSRVSNILNDLVRHTRGLKDSVMSIRAQPVGSVFQRMPRLVRELSAKTGKKVHLEMSGETTEVDKTIIERLSDPMTHIIRNSIDHGIESSSDRLAAGKSDTGTIRLSADQRGGRIVIEISDDGAGINQARVLKKARDRGLVDPSAILSADEICQLIFLPGFSTAETVSDLSGRGVGMDVVRRNIQDLGGRTTLRSEAGRGMTIQLTLPLTLAVMDGMVVEVDRQTYVLPIPNIVECLRPRKEEIHQLLGTAGSLQLRGDIVPLIHLGKLLDVAPTAAPAHGEIVIITESSDGSRFGLVVDELCGHQQVVIKSIEENCGAVHGIAGATILGNGRVAFILDVESLSEMISSDAFSRTRPISIGAAATRSLDRRPMQAAE